MLEQDYVMHQGWIKDTSQGSDYGMFVGPSYSHIKNSKSHLTQNKWIWFFFKQKKRNTRLKYLKSMLDLLNYEDFNEDEKYMNRI